MEKRFNLMNCCVVVQVKCRREVCCWMMLFWFICMSAICRTSVWSTLFTAASSNTIHRRGLYVSHRISHWNSRKQCVTRVMSSDSGSAFSSLSPASSFSGWTFCFTTARQFVRRRRHFTREMFFTFRVCLTGLRQTSAPTVKLCGYDTTHTHTIHIWRGFKGDTLVLLLF